MIADFVFLLWVLALSVPVYWAIPAAWCRTRLGLVCILSATLLLLLSPLILITVTGYGLILAAFSVAHHAGISRNFLKSFSWLIFSPLAFLELIPPKMFVEGLLGNTALSAPILSGFAFLGISYTAIRCFIMIREMLDEKLSNSFEAAAAFLFFGSFVAGPIVGSIPFRQAPRNLSGTDALMAISRLGWGAALFLVIKPFVEGIDLGALTGLSDQSMAFAWLHVYQRFLTLYIDFAGYTDIAIGSALLFGFHLPENFNWPLRAASIREFWQRWHMSLGAFIGTYLFKPIVRQTGKPSRAIFLAFTAVGLWHSVSLQYFIWGLGHGAALALNMILSKKVQFYALPKLVLMSVKLLGWGFTMSYVAFLSAFANEPDLNGAVTLLRRLF